MISRPRSGPAVAQSEEDGVVRVRQGRGGERGGAVKYWDTSPASHQVLKLCCSCYIVSFAPPSCRLGPCLALGGVVLSVATPPVVVAGKITRGPNLTTTITTHTLTGEEGKNLISPPGPFAGQGGVFQGVAVESWVQCSTTTGEAVPTFQMSYSLHQGDGRNICSGQRPSRSREGARIRSNWDSFLPRHLRAGQPYESRGVELLVAISSAMFPGRG